jgi:S1-C subfamily serine protease
MTSLLTDFSNALADAVERAGRSVVAIREGGQNGVSGTVWREGVVVAADHTLRGRDQATLVMPTGDSVSATVTGRDPGTDIAVLQLAGGKTVAAELGSTDELKVGHMVLAVGRRPSGGVTATHGIVSAVSGAFRTWNGGRIDQSLRLDVMPYPGFSGGPLVDFGGRVLGINTSGPRRSVLTIPRQTVERVVSQLLTKGRIARGYLGVGVQPVALPPAVTKSAGNDRGLLVITIAEDSPAHNAGLIVGDILLAADETALRETADLQSALDPENVGKTVGFRVLRGGSPKDVHVTVGERGRNE